MDRYGIEGRKIDPNQSKEKNKKRQIGQVIIKDRTTGSIARSVKQEKKEKDRNKKNGRRSSSGGKS